MIQNELSFLCVIIAAKAKRCTSRRFQLTHSWSGRKRNENTFLMPSRGSVSQERENARTSEKLYEATCVESTQVYGIAGNLIFSRRPDAKLQILSAPCRVGIEPRLTGWQSPPPSPAAADSLNSGKALNSFAVGLS
jgi:hypothetical protein